MKFNKDECDFSGWATKNDLLCADGRTIRHDAFKENDGKVVSLVWNHLHNEPTNVLGHALLENRPNGVYCYCYFNDTENGLVAKELVQHGDIDTLSIYANHLTERPSKNVIHGNICEVSLVHAGANPGAKIDTIIAHSDDEADEGEEAVITSGIEGFFFEHADTDGAEPSEPAKNDDGKATKDEPKKSDDDDETIEDVLDTLNDKQKLAFQFVLGKALEVDPNDPSDDDSDKGGEKTMKHNVFEQDEVTGGYLSHADQADIISVAKANHVSFQTALEDYMTNDETLSHAQIESIEELFPEYKDIRPGAPELITDDQSWVPHVLNKVHKSPISRIRTRFADTRDTSLTAKNLRALGYKKGNEKKEVGNIDLIHRTTDPQTIYVKSHLDRDDIIDITDFDVVAYLYNIDRMTLNEELATAILVGDGREIGSTDKIQEDKIRPIWKDDELYTIHTDIDIEAQKTKLQGSNTSLNFGEEYIYAESIIEALLYAREDYRGAGTPDFFCTPHLVNVMLMARDLNGRRIYDSINDLKAALNVGNIVTVEQFNNLVRTESNGITKHRLLGLMVNLSDYYLGSTKGGQVTHFTDFDIDFNQEKSLLETRVSGAMTRIKAAIALEEPVKN